ncbi:MAG: hypothetical protein QOE35_3414 [Actinomycetota bacterium]|jgi:predicted ATPase/class 3 adenylate cyclase/DNA-binding CsgD family transcriptional regulator
MEETGAVLPGGTVTLLLADVEGSTRLWETEPEVMAAALGRLEDTLVEALGRHNGARPLEQGEGDSFVAAFTRASDAVAAALGLQLADLDPIRLRIGIHTAEVQLRDDANYMGPAMNRTARLRDLGHGGQTLLSQATHDIVVERLPAKATLTDLGTHRLKDLARPEHVHQLGHPELRSEFPPLRSVDAYPNNLPIQLTSFIGREAELDELRTLFREHRLVTLTGSGGAGKTRLAVQVGAELLADFPDGVWHVELAPITDPDLVATSVARAMGLQDEVNRTATETIIRHTAGRPVLVVLDNCEHLLDASASLAEALLRGCPSLTILATTREPLGVAGEATWRVPSLDDTQARRLFEDRARRARNDFAVNDANATAVDEVCRRLDGIPLAIELAAARVRAFSPEQIAAGLNDRFRMLTGGSRTAVQRQQTLRASVDWSHRLLSDAEQVLFRRLAVFPGSFDLEAAQAVGADGDLEPHHVFDLLALLVDKSLVTADETDGTTRYRLLETVRQYAAEQLDTADEAVGTRRLHRDHYVGVTALVGLAGANDRVQLAVELDNFRAAMSWSLEADELDRAVVIAVSLNAIWFDGRFKEGRTWFDEVLGRGPLQPSFRAAALAAAGWLDSFAFADRAIPRALEAVALARDVGDPALIAYALASAGVTQVFTAPEAAAEALRESLALARGSNAGLVGMVLFFLANASADLGDVEEAVALLEEGLVVGSTRANGFVSRSCQYLLAFLLCTRGDLRRATSLATESVADARAAADRLSIGFALANAGLIHALSGDASRAWTYRAESLTVADDLGIPMVDGWVCVLGGIASLATGDVAQAQELLGRWSPHEVWARSALGPLAEADLAAGDVEGARHRADEAMARPTPEMRWERGWALTARARVASAEGDTDLAERLGHQALVVRDEYGDKGGLCDTLELLAALSASGANHEEAARTLGAAQALRDRVGYVRFVIYRDWYDAVVASSRAELGDDAFDAAWAEGAALSLDEAVAYAQRGRGERKRPSAGWASLTPAELDVVRLVADGLPNKEIAARLFISPRTVQAHLTHVYAKVGVSSRVQLATEAAKRS